MFRYSCSVTAFAVLMLFLAPSTVYAAGIETSYPLSSNIQPLTGSAIGSDTLSPSLAESLCTYLIDSYALGMISPEHYNSIMSSGMISENAFFADAVFVGDSLTVGFEQYCRSHSNSVAADTTRFLARVSCSAKAAISPNALTKHAGIMPTFGGSPQYIETSISQMPDVKKVFICFGMNDLTGSTPAQFISDMETLILRIISVKPNAKIYAVSIPCVMSGVNTGALNNSSISKANRLLQETCIANGWGFVNISEYLMGNDGALRPEYSSDNYVHENSKAYEIWNRAFKNYAFTQITN